LAQGPVIFSIDDDAEFSSETTIREALAYFDHPRVGALALPFTNCVRGEYRPAMLASPPDERVWCVPHYVGTAHALARDLFLKLGGYSSALIHWGEEEEYSRKLWGAGYVVRTAATPPIIHYPSPVGRSEWRRRVLGWRNLYMMELWYTPLRHLPYGLARASGKWGKTVLKTPGLKNKLLDTAAVVQGVGAALTHLPARSPLSVAADRIYLRVRGAKSVLLDEIEPLMPAPHFGPVEIE
jgi:GT2 family glycosyltransferase